MKYLIEKPDGNFLKNGDFQRAVFPELNPSLVPSFDCWPMMCEDDKLEDLKELAAEYIAVTGEKVKIVSELEYEEPESKPDNEWHIGGFGSV